MSRDQKPGKVRVIGGPDGGVPSPPQRRATDRDPLAPPGTMDDRGPQSAGAAAAVRPGGRIALLPILVFLICSAAGGIGFMTLVLPGLAQ